MFIYVVDLLEENPPREGGVYDKGDNSGINKCPLIRIEFSSRFAPVCLCSLVDVSTK